MSTPPVSPEEIAAFEKAHPETVEPAPVVATVEPKSAPITPFPVTKNQLGG